MGTGCMQWITRRTIQRPWHIDRGDTGQREVIPVLAQHRIKPGLHHARHPAPAANFLSSAARRASACERHSGHTSTPASGAAWRDCLPPAVDAGHRGLRVWKGFREGRCLRDSYWAPDDECVAWVTTRLDHRQKYPVHRHPSLIEISCQPGEWARAACTQGLAGLTWTRAAEKTAAIFSA